MKELTVGPNDAGQRLDRFLLKAAPLLPSSLCQKYLRLKRFKLNGRAAKGDARLQAGDVLSLYIGDEFFEKPSDENAYRKVASPRLSIVYEDGQILLADKAPGVLCHHAEGEPPERTLLANIQAHLLLSGAWRPKEETAFTPALCNRIDRNTGGIVIAAKTAEALRILNGKIRDRELDKRYLCAVQGRPSPEAGTLRGFLFKDAVKNRVYVRREPEPGARTAVTEYRTLLSRDGLSLVECRLETGRTHQIRAQMADAGWPLLGDGKYGGKRAQAGGETKQALCSYRLTFDFPTDAGCLDYLRGRTFTVSRVDFAEKYFPGYEKYLPPL
ncbi:MAG: RluA family pseudouridine synthase [Oscillospiraceae bacterium]|nr:RluA family pseudouridine synthase [Oscillospiraceae bacterium]